MSSSKRFTCQLLIFSVLLFIGIGYVTESSCQITTQDVQVSGRIRESTDLVLTPDGSIGVLPVWKPLADSCYLAVLDIGTGSVLFDVGLPGNVLRVDVDAAITPSGTHALVSSVNRYSTTDYLSIITLATGASVDLSLPGRVVDGTSDIVLTPDGTRAVIPTQGVALNQGFLSIIDLASQTITHNVSLPGQILTMDVDAVITPDGSQALIPSWGVAIGPQDWLSFVTIATGSRTDLLLPAKLTAGVDVVLTSDGTRALLPLQNPSPGSAGSLTIMDVATASILFTVPLPGNVVVDDIDVVISPGGGKAVIPSTDFWAFTDWISVVDIATGLSTNLALPGRLTDGVDVVITPDASTAIFPQRDIFSTKGLVSVVDIASPVPSILHNVPLPGQVITPDVDVLLMPDGVTALMPSSDLAQNLDFLSAIDITMGGISSTTLTGKLVYFIDVCHMPSGGTVAIPSLSTVGWNDWVTIARNVPTNRALIPVRVVFSQSEEVCVVDLSGLGVSSFSLPGQVLDGVDIKGSSMVGDAAFVDADFYTCRIPVDTFFWTPQTPPAIPPIRPLPQVPPPPPPPKVPPGPCNKPVVYPPEDEAEEWPDGPKPTNSDENYKVVGRYIHILKGPTYPVGISCTQGGTPPDWRPAGSPTWRPLKHGQPLYRCAVIRLNDGTVRLEKTPAVVTGGTKKSGGKGPRPDMITEILDGESNLSVSGYLDPGEYIGEATPIAEAWIDSGVQPGDERICAWVTHDSATATTIIACPIWSVGSICTRSTIVDTGEIHCLVAGQAIVYDSTGVVSFCGDGVLEGTEDCELGIPCVPGDTCHFCHCWTLTTDFIRSDANADSAIAMSDAVFTLKYLYVPGADPPDCMKSADADDTGEVAMSDAIFILKYLYVPGAPEPPAPFPECGPDPTEDELECDDHPCSGTGYTRHRKMKSTD